MKRREKGSRKTRREVEDKGFKRRMSFSGRRCLEAGGVVEPWSVCFWKEGQMARDAIRQLYGCRPSRVVLLPASVCPSSSLSICLSVCLCLLVSLCVSVCLSHSLLLTLPLSVSVSHFLSLSLSLSASSSFYSSVFLSLSLPPSVCLALSTNANASSHTNSIIIDY